jgi:uncharacterized OsmC-like protein
MQERFVITKVRSYSSGTRGRALCNARNHHFVVDDYVSNGGPGEELGAGEAFLSGITACAVNMLERLARESQMPLGWTDVTVEGTRDTEAAPIHENLSVYDAVHLRFELTGLDDDQAQELVGIYKRR